MSPSTVVVGTLARFTALSPARAFHVTWGPPGRTPRTGSRLPSPAPDPAAYAGPGADGQVRTAIVRGGGAWLRLTASCRAGHRDARRVRDDRGRRHPRRHRRGRGGRARGGPAASPSRAGGRAARRRRSRPARRPRHPARVRDPAPPISPRATAAWSCSSSPRRSAGPAATPTGCSTTSPRSCPASSTATSTSPRAPNWCARSGSTARRRRCWWTAGGGNCCA